MAKKITGDFAQTSVGSTVSFTGTLTVGSAVITAPSSTAGLYAGQAIAGTGIPAGTTILSLSPLTMSANATTAGTTVAITGAETQVLGLSDWSADWKRKMVDATTTDDEQAEDSLGSTTSWTAKAKYLYYDGDVTQQEEILAAIQTIQGRVKWNFFVDAVNSDVCWTGYAYIDGISFGAGVGKAVGLDVSLKGVGLLTQTVEVAPIANAATVTGVQAEV